MDRSKWDKMLRSFQAFARGYLVRNEVRRAREDFEDIVQEIDGGLSHLQWRDAVISVPFFTDTQPSTFSSKPSDPALNVSASPRRPSTAAATCLSHERHILSEKIEAERDEMCPSGDCFRSNSVDGDEDGQRHEGVREQQGDNDAGMMENTGDSTSVWSSIDLEVNYGQTHKVSQKYRLPKEVLWTPEALHLHRNTLTMELVWIQQAIDSRKKYLSLKDRLSMS